NLGPCDHVTGEILTGASVWEDDTTTISSFGAMDFCDDPESNFEQYPGWIPGNPLIMMYWNHSENQIYTIQIEPEIEFTYWSSENLTIPLITFDQQILYDLNLDYLTDVADIISTVNVIMDTATQGPFQLALVDSNHDNEIDILDIIIIVNYIMSN
ncbi:MAG: hypothetical protein ACE5D7_10570, partial [Fidelibacterota bacterium]